MTYEAKIPPGMTGEVIMGLLGAGHTEAELARLWGVSRQRVSRKVQQARRRASGTVRPPGRPRKYPPRERKRGAVGRPRKEPKPPGPKRPVGRPRKVTNAGNR
ncbi:MAG: hypothetical protein HY673_01050 [Chloroflexi bacterium]|nr:hypothetical protein [Chloroflexota bacterium]